MKVDEQLGSAGRWYGVTSHSTAKKRKNQATPIIPGRNYLGSLLVLAETAVKENGCPGKRPVWPMVRGNFSLSLSSYPKIGTA